MVIFQEILSPPKKNIYSNFYKHYYLNLYTTINGTLFKLRKNISQILLDVLLLAAATICPFK